MQVGALKPEALVVRGRFQTSSMSLVLFQLAPVPWDPGHENKVTRQVIRSLTKAVNSIQKQLRLGCRDAK